MSSKKKATHATGTVVEDSKDNLVTVGFNSSRGMIFSVGEKSILINGSAAYLVGQEKGVLPVGRYGYTRIRRDEWEAIVQTYGSMAIFKNGLIFAEVSRHRAEDRAAEQAETRHGLEPVDIRKSATEEASSEA